MIDEQVGRVLVLYHAYGPHRRYHLMVCSSFAYLPDDEINHIYPSCDAFHGTVQRTHEPDVGKPVARNYAHPNSDK